MQTSLSSSPTLSFGSVGALRTYSTLVLSKSFSDIWRNISALGSVSIVSVFKWITFFDCSSNTFHWVRTVLHYYLFKLLMSQNYLHSLHLHMFTAISLRCGSKEGNGEEGKNRVRLELDMSNSPVPLSPPAQSLLGRSFSPILLEPLRRLPQ